MTACFLVLAGVGLVRRRPAHAQRPAPREPGPHPGLRRPDNMPSSNEKGEGFENKIAELIAKELKSKLTYVWYPTRRGYFRILNGMYCDMAMEAPAGLDMTGVTKPYFRSGYVFVARQGSGLEDLKSLADPRLKKLKIGVNMYTSDAENSPPAMALSRYGVVGNLTGYFTFFSDQERPEDIIKGVANKDVDLAIAWGPLAGYFAKQSPVPLDAHAAPGEGHAERHPVPVQHGHRRPPAGQGLPRQPPGGARPAAAGDRRHPQAVQRPDAADRHRGPGEVRGRHGQEGRAGMSRSAPAVLTAARRHKCRD